MKSFVNRIVLICSVPYFFGCTSNDSKATQNISPEVSSTIAYCSAGIESGTVLKITGAVIENGGKIDVNLRSKLAGVFASQPGLKSSDVVKLQEKYMECLDKKQLKEGTEAIVACQSKLKCELDMLEMACGCRTSIEEIASENSLSESKKSQWIMRECYSGQYSLKKCWDGKEPNSARAACTVTLNNADVTLPSPGPCIAASETKAK